MAEGETVEPTTPIVRKNPFGLEKPVVDVARQQEIVDKVQAIQERTQKLLAGLIPLEEMTPSEKAAYLLKHLKD